MRSPTQDTHRPCPGSLRHLRPSGSTERFFEVARLSPIARALAPSGLTLELRSLCSTIITRFLATADLSATRRGPAWSSRIAGWDLASRCVGLPVLTRESLARMSTPLPRRLGPVRLLLTSRTDGGLRPFIAGSALALAVSRPARAFTHVSTCVLAGPPFGAFYTRGFDPGRYRSEPLRLLPAGATVAGWDIFLPRDSRALCTAHDKVELRTGSLRMRVTAAGGWPGRGWSACAI
jgi:hypothetical protein